MRMQVILDSSFAHPGSVPIWGGKKGEFRDWTRVLTANFFHYFSFRSATISRLKKLQFRTGVSQMNGFPASTLGLL